MRTLIFVTLFCVLVAVVFAKAKGCNDSSECGEDECCVRNIMMGGYTCQNYRQKGQFCIRHPKKVGDTDVYFSWCPCGDGLKCEPEEVREENGVVVFKNAKCQ